MSKKVLLISLGIFLGMTVAIWPLVSQASVFQGGDNLVISEEVDGNLFIAGNFVTINATVNGDIFVAGGNVIINGLVNGDIFAVGSNISIGGEVKGNVRLAGSNIILRSPIERNALIATSNLLIEETAEIGRHLTFAGPALILNSPVNGKVDAYSHNVILNNKVAGDVLIKLDKEGILKLSSTVAITGNLNYSADKEAEIVEGATVGGTIDFQKRILPTPSIKKDDVAKFFQGMFWVWQLISLVSLFIIGLLLISLAPKPLKHANELMKKKFWPCFGWGLIFLLLTPLVCLLLLISVVGIPLSFITLALYFIALFIAKAVAALMIGRLLTDSLKWKVHLVVSLIIGLLVFWLISLVPLLGWLVCFVLVVWAFGGLIKTKGEMMKDWR